jgi:hypothetical protein
MASNARTSAAVASASFTGKPAASVDAAAFVVFILFILIPWTASFFGLARCGSLAVDTSNADAAKRLRHSGKFESR